MNSRFVSWGTSVAGNVRGNNEDQVYRDPDRGIFLVVDGMGGQAAGEEAAEIAVQTIRGRLERPTESAEQRVREAIALANNAIYEAAAGNPAWRGMACVLTLALIEDGHAIIGHVGDSRAYQIRNGKIQKITRDHSPVGEREDMGELSEEAAMRHPRRNEVFRDVGSAPRTPDDPDFIEIHRITVPDDSALLLCSDGLSDVVPSRRILQTVEQHPQDCAAAVRMLVNAAVADGKDNVSVVLVEGRKFPGPVAQKDLATTKPPLPVTELPPAVPVPALNRAPFVLIGLLIGLTTWAGYNALFPPAAPARVPGAVIRVGQAKGEFASVPEALGHAIEGDIVELSPGVYPEKIVLKDGITVRAVPPRSATIAGGVVADSVRQATLRDVAVGLGGIESNNSNLRIDGVDCEGPIVFAGNSAGMLRGSRIGSLQILDTSAPEVGVNFIQGDIEFSSSGPLKIDGNSILGVLFQGAPPAPRVAAELLKRNIFTAKRPMQPAGDPR
jgi:serine/threonine protein phosphatase PrpC